MTQRDRILAMLREAGERGVHSFALYQAHIPRAAARVRELRERGFDIESTRAGKGTRYTLRAGPGGGASSSLNAAPRSNPPRRVDAREARPDERYGLVWDYDSASPNYMRAYWERPAVATQPRLAA